MSGKFVVADRYCLCQRRTQFLANLFSLPRCGRDDSVKAVRAVEKLDGADLVLQSWPLRCLNLQVLERRIMMFVDLNILHSEERLVNDESKYHTSDGRDVNNHDPLPTGGLERLIAQKKRRYREGASFIRWHTSTLNLKTQIPLSSTFESSNLSKPRLTCGQEQMPQKSYEYCAFYLRAEKG